MATTNDLEESAVALLVCTGGERARLLGLHATRARVDIAHDHEDHLLAARLLVEGEARLVGVRVRVRIRVRVRVRVS